MKGVDDVKGIWGTIITSLFVKMSNGNEVTQTAFVVEYAYATMAHPFV